MRWQEREEKYVLLPGGFGAHMHICPVCRTATLSLHALIFKNQHHTQFEWQMQSYLCVCAFFSGSGGAVFFTAGQRFLSQLANFIQK
jgi:hypothetical protein